MIAEGRHITKDSITLSQSKSARRHQNESENKKRACLSAPQSKAASTPSNPTPLSKFLTLYRAFPYISYLIVNHAYFIKGESLMGDLEALDLNAVDEKIEQEEVDERLKDSLPPPFLSLKIINMGHNLV